jgi:hypothetical protein
MTMSCTTNGANRMETGVGSRKTPSSPPPTQLASKVLLGMEWFSGLANRLRLFAKTPRTDGLLELLRRHEADIRVELLPFSARF